MKIAALLTCYNRVETTLRCLKQFVAQKLPADCLIDIYLVDDASPDKTGEKVKAWFKAVAAPKFKLNVIMGEGNLFWCKGMRLAWDTAIASGISYDYYLWLNDDVSLNENALMTVLADCHKCGEPDGVIVGSFSTDSTEREVSYSAMLATGEKLVPCGTPQRADGPINGNCVLIPQAAYMKTGAIYGGYHHGCGDYDYAFVMRRRCIPYFSSSSYVGQCPRQPERYYNLKGWSLLGRLKLLFAPKGYSLHDAVLYKWRNYGMLRAFVSFFHITLSVLLAIEPGRK